MALSSEERAARARVANRKWYLTHKEKILTRQKAYQKANRQKISEYHRAWEAARTPEQKAAAQQRYRNKNWRVQNMPDVTRPEPDKCECCGGISGKALALDHCHKTGVFRGWLCARCNMGLGLLGDGVESVQRAIDYLKRSQQ